MWWANMLSIFQKLVTVERRKFYSQSWLFFVDQIFKCGLTSENKLFSEYYFTAKQTYPTKNWWDIPKQKDANYGNESFAVESEACMSLQW